MYVYSSLAIVALAWGLKAVTDEDPKRTFYFAHIFVADHLLGTIWTVFFAVLWWVYNPHDGEKVVNSAAQEAMAGAHGNTTMTHEERVAAAQLIWNKEKGLAAAVLIAGWISKIYFAALIYSYATHLRQGSYRTLPMTAALANSISNNGDNTLMESDLESDDETDGSTLYRMPVRTPRTGDNFAEFSNGPSRGRKPGTSKGSKLGEPIDSNEEEVLWDEEEERAGASGMSSKLETESDLSSSTDPEMFFIVGFAYAQGSWIRERARNALISYKYLILPLALLDGLIPLLLATIYRTLHLLLFKHHSTCFSASPRPKFIGASNGRVHPATTAIEYTMATTSGNGTPVKDSAKSSPSSKSTSGSRTTVSSGSGGSRGRTLTRNNDPLSPANLEKRGYHTFTTMGRKFHVEKRWKFVRELGQGAYGFVVSAQDQISGETVAIKLVTRLFEKIQLSKRALREISLLRHFANHENVRLGAEQSGAIPVHGANVDNSSADLHQIVRSGQNLSNAHVQYFLYQILRAMKYVHSAGVIHRDLKPGRLPHNRRSITANLLDRESFGFDSAPEPDGTGFMTEYVATRWYRAPEIMLSFRKYTTAIDIWSIGCILGELLGMKPMFKGKDYVDQLNIIIDILGTPDEETLQRIGSVKVGWLWGVPIFVLSLFYRPKPIYAVSRLKSKSPSSPYFHKQTTLAYHDEDDEPECESKYEHWKEIEKLETIDQFRTAIWNEVEEFRREVREMVVEPEPEVKLNGIAATSEKVDETKATTPVVAESPIVIKEGGPSEPVDKLTPVDEDVPNGTIPFPSSGRASPSPAAGSVPLPRQRPVSARTKSNVDPYEAYARRSSVLASASPQALTGNLPPGVVDSKDAQSAGGEPQATASYIVPARSRAGSAADSTISSGGFSGHGTFPRTILRTLSTLSVNDSGAAGAAAVALGRIKGDKEDITAADAPPSSIPVEFRPKN
ncbi:CMGC/MAPK protein kinase [Rhizoctonia solani AG-1 IA]|uniref:mitogen-activated protein kinase n=1 Tax=Thanatephorus cucumeris (strain AG1-IA) TaxID=983506 RepID=L8WZG4_THACA|nr:CMGC/MAPK protein kinase [Rhizoctonia solani AG-1 IA]